MISFSSPLAEKVGKFLVSYIQYNIQLHNSWRNMESTQTLLNLMFLNEARDKTSNEGLGADL